MKITFLGTGAADWNINEHKDIVGFRRNASALVDGCLLIDPGPAVIDALTTFGIDPNGIKYVINTHRHSDHYSAQTLSNLPSATLYVIEDGATEQIGKYKITALKGNHSTVNKIQHYIISDGEKNIFYGLDGAWLLYDEVAAIKASGVDFAVFDCTVGNVLGDFRIFEHNNINMVLEMKSTLAPYIGRFCISHMARTLHASHEELSEQMKKYGIEVAYDGLETEI